MSNEELVEYMYLLENIYINPYGKKILPFLFYAGILMQGLHYFGKVILMQGLHYFGKVILKRTLGVYIIISEMQIFHL